jgi:hypothetical protein
MSNVRRVYVEKKPAFAVKAKELQAEIKSYLGIAFIPDYCLSRESKDLYVVRTKEKLPSRQMVASINPTLPVSQSTEEFLKLLPEL